MPIPRDYEERVYAGVLGKIIGVYLGRPFEMWSYDRILKELGEIDYYVNDKLPGNPPIVVTDDDISGTFTFLRAFPDYGNSRDLTPAQIGQTWLNYIIEGRTILWWGGLGNSTEHTAYLRLKGGIEAPASGSIALNGKIIAEQIGSQIFIDGWAMVAPGNPKLAADLAGRAASVSHDGEAIFGAQVIAAMEALAFIEPDIDKLIDCGVSFIPQDSVIYRMIADIRHWHAAEPDWHKTRLRIGRQYNTERYGGVCHIVPNHALIIMGLLYGNDDFHESMKVVNTAGWDTDCNAGNLGCLLGIKNGLAAFDSGPDWRGPVADRLYLATADGGRAITNALAEAYHVAAIGRFLDEEQPLRPKNRARFHFELPGSVQGFYALTETASIANVTGHSQLGNRALALQFQGSGQIATPTFILPDELNMEGYRLMACPTLYPGQTVRAGLSVDRPAKARLFVQAYNQLDELSFVAGPPAGLKPGSFQELAWPIPDMGGQPIATAGVDYMGEKAATLFLDYLTWDGTPDVVLARPEGGQLPSGPPLVWRRAWIDGMDQWSTHWPEAYRLVQNDGRGLIMQGTREWTDYQVSATVTAILIARGGIAIRAQGMRRYYALLLCNDGKARLAKALDGDQFLAETDFSWQVHQPYDLRLQAEGQRLRGWVNDRLICDVLDEDRPLTGGGAAFVLEEGTMMSQAMTIKPLDLQ